MMSVKKVRSVSSQQVSRHRPLPEKLRELLNVINFIPLDRKLPFDQWEWLEMQPPHSTIIMWERSGAVWEERFRNVVEKFPDKLKEFVGPVHEDNLRVLWFKYMTFVEAREVIQKIISVYAKLSYLDYDTPTYYFTSVTATIGLGINRQRKLTFDQSWLLEALDEVEGERIRECPVCHKVFWAGRLDKQCCSKNCNGVYRTRKWRKNSLLYKKSRQKSRQDKTKQFGDVSHQINSEDRVKGRQPVESKEMNITIRRRTPRLHGNWKKE